MYSTVYIYTDVAHVRMYTYIQYARMHTYCMYAYVLCKIFNYAIVYTVGIDSEDIDSTANKLSWAAR